MINAINASAAKLSTLIPQLRELLSPIAEVMVLGGKGRQSKLCRREWLLRRLSQKGRVLTLDCIFDLGVSEADFWRI